MSTEEEGKARYAAYAARVKTMLLARANTLRYTAYTSDIGESFRPVAHPYLVKGGYAISGLYVIADVFYDSTKYSGNEKLPAVCKRTAFQVLSSLLLPAFTIHSVVKYSGKAMKDFQNKTLRVWGPIGLGLSTVPALPYMFDKPVEHLVDGCAEKIEQLLRKPKFE